MNELATERRSMAIETPLGTPSRPLISGTESYQEPTGAEDKKLPELYYLEGKYYRQNSQGTFTSIATGDARIELRYLGYGKNKVHNEASETDVALRSIQLDNSVQGAGPLCGRMPGLVTENGFKYLVTRGPKILSAGIKLFAASKESCSKDTCRHPECDNVANCFHLTRMDAVHVSKQRNLFYKKISTSASVEGQNARFRECFFPHEMPIVEDQSLVKGVGAIFQASTTCRSYERCSSWTLFNNGCKGKSKSSTPCRNGTESRDEIDLINCYHDSSSVGCYHQRWMQIFCKKIR